MNVILFVLPIVGILSLIVYSQIAGKKELEKRKKGFVAKTFAEKIPQEYTEKERKHAKRITIFLIISALLMILVAILFGKSGMRLIRILTVITMLGWLFLVKKSA